MKIFFLSLFILSVSFSSFAQHKNFDLTKLDSYFEKSRKEWNLPGLSVAIVRNDTVILSKGYGIKSIDKSENDPSNKVDDHTLFAIASLSKAFTTASLGKLVETGKIKWNDKVTNYLPYFQMYDPYVTREMTIRDLVSHRSGLETFSGDLVWWGTTHSRKEVIESVRYLKPASSFRSKYGYQNLMFLSAGEIIPAVTGKSWDEFVRDSIFVPLGMTETNTSVRYLTTGVNYATPHVKWNDKLITVPYRNVDNVGAAAAINSNVHDLSKWIRMWLRKGDKSVVNDNIRHEVWTPQTILPISKRGLEAMPSRHFSAAAMGWFTFDYHGRKILNHSGGMDGMISYLVLVPEEKFGFVILSNSYDTPAGALMIKVLDYYLAGIDRDWSAESLEQVRKGEAQEKSDAEKREMERNKNSKPSLALNEYAGTYHSALYGDVKVLVKDKSFVLNFIPTPSFNDAKLTHWQYDTFQIELADKTLPKGWVGFVLDREGKSVEMKIDIPNPDFDFGELELKKIK